MEKTYTKLQRVLALALALVLGVTLLPVDGLTAFAAVQNTAADALGIIEWADDPITGTRPTDTFMDMEENLGSTLNAGKILVGKSVNDGVEGGRPQPVDLHSELFNMPQAAQDSNYGKFRPSEDGNFLITVSQSSQMYGVSSKIPVPMDVVFVLDTSGSMERAADDDDNRAQAVVEAANKAIADILTMNTYNRVAVVGFSSSASTMSRLYHYTDSNNNNAASEHLTWSNSYNRSGNIRGRSTNGAVDTNNDRNGTEGGTNIQDGILQGAKILTGVPANDTYVMLDVNGDGNEEKVTRMPILVLLSDGAATYSEEDQEWWDADGNRQGPGRGSYAGNGFLAALTASYYKDIITQHYYGAGSAERADIYTIGVGLGSIDRQGDVTVPDSQTGVSDVVLAHWTMDPSRWLGGSANNSNIDENFNSYWTQYTAAAASAEAKDFSVSISSGSSYKFANKTVTETYKDWEWQRVPGGGMQLVEVEKTRTLSFDNVQESVTDLKYNDAYWAASSTDEINKAFGNLVITIQKRAITAPTLTNTVWGENNSGFVSFTDPIGEYMEVKRIVGVTGDGYLYEGKGFAEYAQKYDPNWSTDSSTTADQAAFNAELENALMERIQVSTAAGAAMPTMAQVRSILDVVTRTETEGDVIYNDGTGVNRTFDWDTYGGQIYHNSDSNFSNSFVWFGKVYYPEGETEGAANAPFDVQFIGVAPKNADSAEWLHTKDGEGGTNADKIASAKAAGANCVVRSYFLNGKADGNRTDSLDMLYFQLRVMTSLDEPHQQYVSIKTPASLLSTQKVLIDDTDPNAMEAHYNALIPSRVVYEVGLRSDINANNVWSIVEEDYLSERLFNGDLANVDNKGNILFFTNDWDRSATVESHTRALAHANFDVSNNNTFYRYEKDTRLLDASGNPITRAPEVGQTYYYSRTYYKWAPDDDGISAATADTELIAVTWPADVTAKEIDGKYYIPAGLYTAHTLTAGDDLLKDDNTTGTASVVTHPVRTSSANDPSYTTWLGNNGRLTFKGIKPKNVTGDDITTAAVETDAQIDGKAVKVDDVLTYTINAVNTNDTAAKIVITDTIPAGTKLVDGGAAVVNGNVLTWTFDDVAAGAAVSVSFKVTVLESAVAEGTVANSANIKVGENEYTTNITTNSVVGKQVVNVPAEGLKVGDAVEFHIAFVNTTGQTADITVTDIIPAGTEFRGETSHAQELAVDNGTLTWTLDNVAPGARGVITFTVYVDAGVSAVEGVTNSASYTVENGPTITTNTVKVPVKTGSLSVSKTVSGTQTNREFTLTLTELTGKLNGSYALTGSTQSAVTFTGGVAELAIKHGETLTVTGLPVGVTVRVTETVPAGYTATYAPANTVTVAEGSNAVLVTVTNTYKAAPTDDIKTMLGVKKRLVSPVALSAKTFYFTAQPVEVTEGADGSITVGRNTGDALVTSITIGSGEGVNDSGLAETFYGKVFTESGTYYYLISEQNGALEGITYDEHQYLVKIVISDKDENGRETGYLKVDSLKMASRANADAAWSAFGPHTTPEFVNKYVPADIDLVLEGTKVLTGRKLIPGEFTFVLTETGRPSDVAREVVLYGTNDADGKILFDPIYYSAVGEYTYEIAELKTFGQDHMTFDSMVEKVTVTVTANADGVLSASVAYVNENDTDHDEIKFSNTYTTQDVSYTPVATKTLTGNKMNAGDFTFAVFEYKNSKEGAQVSTGRITTGANSGEPVNISFSAIPYSLDSFTGGRPTANAEETFTYILRELLPTTGASDRVTYDKSAFTFTVKLKYDASTGKLEAVYNNDMQRICDKNGNAVTVVDEAAAFSNVYTPESIAVNVTPNVTKTVVGATDETAVPSGLTFGFQIIKAAEAVFTGGTSWYPDNNDNTRYTVNDVVGVGTSGATVEGSTSAPTTVSFGAMRFYEPGVYKAWIVENNAGTTMHGIAHDANRYLMVINVTHDTANGTLEAAVKYYKGTGTDPNTYNEEIVPSETNALSFKNTYNASGSMTVTAKKVLENHGDAHAFSFTLTEVGGSGAVHTGTSDPVTGNIVFDTLLFDGEDMGSSATQAEKQYIMAEVPGADPGIIYDKSQYRLTVKLTSTGGIITGEVSKIEQIADKNGASCSVDVTDGVVFTNVGTVYQGTDIEFKLSKVLNGRDMKANEFGFALIHVSTTAPDGTVTTVNRQVDGAVVPAAKQGEKVTMTIKRSYSASVKPGTVITYRLSELPGSLEGVTYDKSVYEIKVKITDDDRNGILEAAVISKQLVTADGNGTEVLTDVLPFVNTYKAASITHNLNGTKKLTGRDMDAGEFVFEVAEESFTPAGSTTPTRTNSGVVTTGRSAAGTDGAEVSFAFDPITYHEAGTYVYLVTERAGNRAGVAYSKAAFRVTVTVMDDGSGELEVTGESIVRVKDDKGDDSGAGNAIAFNNHYAPEKLNVAPYLEITKDLTGRFMVADEFDFVVHEFNNNQVGSEVISVGTNDDNGKVTFSSFSVDKEDTYEYLITESTTAAPGVTTDGRKIKVTVTVSDNSNGVLSVDSVVYTELDPEGSPEQNDATNAQTFYNTYKASPVNGSFTVYKELVGKAFDKETFKFNVSLEKDGVSQTLTDNELTVNKTGSVLYPYTYTESGTYVWTIREIPDTVENTNGTMTYDTAYTITETVMDNDGRGQTWYDKLVITSRVIKKDGAAAQSVSFRNVYTPNAVKQTLETVLGGKTLTGRDMKDGEFTFIVKNVQGVEVARGTNKADGSIVMEYDRAPVVDGVQDGGLTFTAAGTYYYTVSEEAGTAASVIYDPAVWTVRIDVTYDAATGKLAAADPVITEVKDRAVAADKITFANVYDPVDASVQLKGVKTLTKDHTGTVRPMIPGEFEFHLLNASDALVRKAYNDANGNIVFDPLTFDRPTTQDLEFTIVEVNSGAVGVTYSDAVYTVTVAVVDNTVTGELEPVVTVKDASGTDVTNSWTYENSYKGLPAHVTVHASKVLNGKDLLDGEFSFELKQTGKPVGAADTVIIGATNDADGNISFRVENLAENGTYTFEMSEVEGADNRVAYSDAKYTVYIDVTDPGSGYKVANIRYKTGSAPVFTNTYKPEPAAVTVRAEKKLTGRDLQAGEFKFVIEDANGFKLADGTNTADGTILFTSFKLAEGRGQQLYIREVKGDDRNVTYDGKVYVLSVDMVNENEAGVLVPTVHYPVDGVVFNNKYEVPEDPVVPEPVPDTGDNTPVALWMLLMTVSLCGMVVLGKKRRFQNN